jgi:hypothetical protein
MNGRKKKKKKREEMKENGYYAFLYNFTLMKYWDDIFP